MLTRVFTRFQKPVAYSPDDTRRYISIMDKTIINILTFLISGSGFFMALTKFNVPQLNQTFLGTNPFLIKRDKIDSVMTGVFTLLAISGLLLQLYSEIWGEIYNKGFIRSVFILTSQQSPP